MSPCDFEYDPDIWQNMTGELLHSPYDANDIAEAAHWLLGLEYFKGFPLLLPRELLARNSHLLGSPGSGKTSQILMPLLLTLLRGYRVGTDPSGNELWSDPEPTIVIDHKGSIEMLQAARYMSERMGRERAARLQQSAYQLIKAGQKKEAEDFEKRADDCLHSFKFFTLGPDPTMLFNPILEFARDGTTSTVALANLLLDGLAINYGQGYGRGFYSRQSMQLLNAILQQKPQPQTFEEMHAVAEKLCRQGSSQFREPDDLMSILSYLRSYPQLVTQERQHLDNPEQCIFFPEVLSKGQTVYFWLPATDESVVVKAVSNLILASLFVTAKLAHKRGLTFRGHVIVDEAHFAIEKEYANILSVLRSAGLGVLSSHQSLSQINFPDFDARPILQDLCRVKMVFDCEDTNEQKDLIEASGEEYVRETTETSANSLAALPELESGFHGRPDGQTFTHAVSLKARLMPRLTKNAIQAINADEHAMLAKATPFCGRWWWAQPGYIQARTTWPVTKPVYDEWKQPNWPSAREYGLPVHWKKPADDDAVPPVPTADPVPTLKSPPPPALLANMKKKIKEVTHAS